VNTLFYDRVEVGGSSLDRRLHIRLALQGAGEERLGEQDADTGAITCENAHRIAAPMGDLGDLQGDEPGRRREYAQAARTEIGVWPKPAVKLIQT
jgi:hypothetical protein